MYKNYKVIHTKIMKLFKSIICAVAICVISAFSFLSCGCSQRAQKLKIYDTSTGKILSLSLEDYVAGVTSAEIDISFSDEAIACQSIIARTFAMWFISNSKSKYAGADISNDITEAQAYTTEIPDKIRSICKSTKGEVLKIDGDYFLPYYCSNCGGQTSTAKDVFVGNTTNYTTQVNSCENSQNSKNYQWEASVDKSTILHAMSSLGKSLASVTSFKKGKVDESGRCLTFVIGGIEINANSFRLAVGSTIIKSCLITNITVNSNNVSLSGLGYGHGVGLSQWGANIMATNNNNYKEILYHFFPNSKLTRI